MGARGRLWVIGVDPGVGVLQGSCALPAFSSTICAKPHTGNPALSGVGVRVGVAVGGCVGIAVGVCSGCLAEANCGDWVGVLVSAGGEIFASAVCVSTGAGTNNTGSSSNGVGVSNSGVEVGGIGVKVGIIGAGVGCDETT